MNGYAETAYGLVGSSMPSPATPVGSKAPNVSDAYERASNGADMIEKALYRIEALADKLVGPVPSKDGAGTVTASDPSIVGALYSHAERVNYLGRRLHDAMERVDIALGLPR